MFYSLGHFDILEYLVQQNADVNAMNKFKDTALSLAVRIGNQKFFCFVYIME